MGAWGASDSNHPISENWTVLSPIDKTHGGPVKSVCTPAREGRGARNTAVFGIGRGRGAALPPRPAAVDVITTDYFLEQRTFPPKTDARMRGRTALCGGIRFEPTWRAQKQRKSPCMRGATSFLLPGDPSSSAYFCLPSSAATEPLNMDARYGADGGRALGQQ